LQPPVGLCGKLAIIVSSSYFNRSQATLNLIRLGLEVLGAQDEANKNDER
jgi:hypothetical protein